jgi:hypothetical protein
MIFGDCSAVDCTVSPISGINKNLFGFYIHGPDTGSGFGGNFWTVDSLNNFGGAEPGGNPQALTYVGAADTWTLAFEDQALGHGADGDHNDKVISIESLLVPVPEPGSILLLGTALLGCAGILRRRATR